MICNQFLSFGSADNNESRTIPVAQVHKNQTGVLNDEHFDLEP